MDVVILSIVVALAVILSVVATWRAQRSIGLTRSQKTAQVVLAWILPFIGAVGVIVMSIEPGEREKRAAGAGDPGVGAMSGSSTAEAGHHHGSHGHGHDAGHSGDGGGHGGDGGGGH